jgi:hypothetical protein
MLWSFLTVSSHVLASFLLIVVCMWIYLASSKDVFENLSPLVVWYIERFTKVSLSVWLHNVTFSFPKFQVFIVSLYFLITWSGSYEDLIPWWEEDNYELSILSLYLHCFLAKVFQNFLQLRGCFMVHWRYLTQLSLYRKMSRNAFWSFKSVMSIWICQTPFKTLWCTWMLLHHSMML